MTKTAVAALAALLALLPAALAHEAPVPRDFETRLLHDWNDDCGGDGGASAGACRGSLDLIALDLSERHDPALGHLAVLRFILDQGAAGPQQVRLSFDAGGPRSFTLATEDGATFTGTGFARVGNATALGDGTRFAVEAAVGAAALGGAGAVLSGFRLEAAAGDGTGDLMPGGCRGATGDCADAGRSATQYVKPSHALRGPGYYASLAPPADARAGGVVEVTLRNELRRSAQAFTLTATATPGLEAVFHDAAGREAATLQATLGGAQSTTLHLLVRGNVPGTVTVEAVSDLGGRTLAQVPVAAGTGGGATGPEPSRGLPAPMAGLLLAGLAAAAAARRRLR